MICRAIKISFFLLLVIAHVSYGQEEDDDNPIESEVDVIEIEDLDGEDENDEENVTGSDITSKIKIQDIIEARNEYRYAAFGRPDPFVQPIFTLGNLQEVTAGDSEVPMISSLQKYNLGQLKVVGIWQLSSGPFRAMVMTPNQQGIIIRKDDPIALGKVLKIDNKQVVTRQYKIRDDGSREFADITLLLRKEYSTDVKAGDKK